MIRDKIVFGTTDQMVKERLLTKSNLTLQTAEDMCRAAEISKQQIKRFLQPPPPEVLHQVTPAMVRDFLFADDCALAAHSDIDLQELADCFATAAKIFGLTVSIKKTEVLRQLAPNTARPPPNITMDRNALKYVDAFKYLGSCINSAANHDDEVLCRISQASQAFGHLHT